MLASDVVVVTTDNEPLGRVLLEALSLEIPIVAAAAGGPREIIGDNERGLSFAAGDATGLAARIVETISDAASTRARTTSRCASGWRPSARQSITPAVSNASTMRSAPRRARADAHFVRRLPGSRADLGHAVRRSRQTGTRSRGRRCRSRLERRKLPVATNRAGSSARPADRRLNEEVLRVATSFRPALVWAEKQEYLRPSTVERAQGARRIGPALQSGSVFFAGLEANATRG